MTVEIKVERPADEVFGRASGEAKLNLLWWKIHRLEKQIVEIARSLGTEVDISGY